MKSIPKSNLFYANKVVRLYLLAIEEVIGKNGLNASLNLAHLSHLVENYPPENLDKEFDFADFSTINLSLEEVYGVKGGRLLSQRAGKTFFGYAARAFGEQAGLTQSSFTGLPSQEKLRKGLMLIASASNALGDQSIIVEERENDFLYTIKACPSCWGRSGEEKPICSMTAGFLQGCLEYLLDGNNFSLEEEKCHAVGDPACQFVIRQPAESQP